MSARNERLDPRAWLLWASAAGLPPLIGRNPFVLAATLLATLAVRAAWARAAGATGIVAWRGVIQLAAIFAAVGVAFNVLTAHVGDRMILRLPDELLIVGGPLTLNALVYGVLSGVALLTLVLVGTTVGSVLDAPALLRLLPARLTTVAVAGSVAWAFVPQTAAALNEIREAQAARGFRLRGVRDLVPLLVPLLTGGLERALTLAEALESRGFGVLPSDPAGAEAVVTGRPWRGVLTALGLAAGVVGAYLLAVERPSVALATLAIAGFALAVAGRASPGERGRRTRHRPPRWTRADTLVAAAAGVVLTTELLTLRLDPAALRYEPYPSLTPPPVDLPLLAALALLLAPVAVAPDEAVPPGPGPGGASLRRDDRFHPKAVAARGDHRPRLKTGDER